jgi:hypothetical protein
MGEVMDDAQYQGERRRQARLERLRCNDPVCLFCPENDPACLEIHHLAGETFGDDTIIVCRNCHRKLSDKQQDHPPIVPGSPTSLGCQGRLLLGISDAFELLKAPAQLVELIREAGSHLIDYGQAFRPTDGEDQ